MLQKTRRHFPVLSVLVFALSALIHPTTPKPVLLPEHTAPEQEGPKIRYKQVGSDITCSDHGEKLGAEISLSRSGTRIAVGVPGFVIGTPVGAVRVYELAGNAWRQLGDDLAGDIGNGHVGTILALNGQGNVVVFGSYDHNENTGRVWVYQYINGDWQPMGAALDGKAKGDFFGQAVSINAQGDRIAVGSPQASAAGARSGQVSVYEFKGGQWKLLGAAIPGKRYWTYSGSAVDLNARGDVLAVGAPENDDHGNNAGIVEIFRFNGSAWIKQGSDIHGAAPENQCGNDIALNAAGNTIAVGTKFHNDLNGHVRVYKYVSADWQLVGAEIKGAGRMDHFGSVAINGAGTRIAGGAFWNSQAGKLSGHVRVFDLAQNNWVQQGNAIDGKAYELAGISVSMSDNGALIAVGAPGVEAMGGPLGVVRVYRLEQE